MLHNTPQLASWTHLCGEDLPHPASESAVFPPSPTLLLPFLIILPFLFLFADPSSLPPWPKLGTGKFLLGFAQCAGGIWL